MLRCWRGTQASERSELRSKEVPFHRLNCPQKTGPNSRTLCSDKVHLLAPLAKAKCHSAKHLIAHVIQVPSAADGLQRPFADLHRRYTGYVNASARTTGHQWQRRDGSGVIDEMILRNFRMNRWMKRLGKQTGRVLTSQRRAEDIPKSRIFSSLLTTSAKLSAFQSVLVGTSIAAFARRICVLSK